VPFSKNSPRILYPIKLSFKIYGGIKVFHDKQKLKEYINIKQSVQKILKGILHIKMKAFLIVGV
jgi:hypothetical protein